MQMCQILLRFTISSLRFLLVGTRRRGRQTSAMKILRDACAKEGVLLLCCSDEDVLCGAYHRRGSTTRIRSPADFAASPSPPSSTRSAASAMRGEGSRSDKRTRRFFAMNAMLPSTVRMRHIRFILAGVRPSAAPRVDEQTKQGLACRRLLPHRFHSLQHHR
ncbi:uncharacterized protein LOC121986380 isoform X2 [Zingiber officinale]|nr:uncharacterized protein LOC121986380 isoform X2 [Zingiber officinale]